MNCCSDLSNLLILGLNLSIPLIQLPAELCVRSLALCQRLHELHVIIILIGLDGHAGRERRIFLILLLSIGLLLISTELDCLAHVFGEPRSVHHPEAWRWR